MIDISNAGALQSEVWMERKSQKRKTVSSLFQNMSSSKFFFLLSILLIQLVFVYQDLFWTVSNSLLLLSFMYYYNSYFILYTYSIFYYFHYDFEHKIFSHLDGVWIQCELQIENHNKSNSLIFSIFFIIYKEQNQRWKVLIYFLPTLWNTSTSNTRKLEFQVYQNLKYYYKMQKLTWGSSIQDLWWSQLTQWWCWELDHFLGCFWWHRFWWLLWARQVHLNPRRLLLSVNMMIDIKVSYRPGYRPFLALSMYLRNTPVIRPRYRHPGLSCVSALARKRRPFHPLVDH